MREARLIKTLNLNCLFPSYSHDDICRAVTSCELVLPVSSTWCMVKGFDYTGLLGDIKEDWGSGDPSGVQGQSPGTESGGRSPPVGSRGRAPVGDLRDAPEAEAF